MATQLSLLLLGLLATASAIPIEPKAGDDNGVLHDRGSVIGGLRPLPKKEGHGDLVGENHPPPVGGLLGGQREPPVHHDSNGFELPPPGGEGHLVGGQRPGRLAPGQIVGTGVIVGSHRIPLHGVGSDEELEGGLRPPHDINNEPLIGGEHPHPRKIAGGKRPPPIGQGSEEELENGLRPPHDIEHEPLIGGEHPHPRKIAGGERPPPVHGGDSNEELQNGLRPPHDIDDEPLIGGEHPHPRKIAGGERPPIHPEDDEEEVAGGYRPPHDINNKPLVGGEHPHHDGLEEEVGVKPWTPRPKTSARPPFRVTPGQAYNGLPIPLGEKYWFLYDVPLEGRNDFFRIINTPTYTKVETRKYVNKWAERQGAKKVKEVEAFEDEDDHYHSEVRVALDNIFEALPDVYGKIKDIQDNPHFTKEGEVQQELAVFSAQEDIVRDALIYILKRVDYKGEVQIPIPKK